jgi:hypothetical protein
MKKRLLSIVVLSSLAMTASAQGLYFRAGLGYAMPQAGQTITGSAYELPYRGSLSNEITYDLKGASFSAGLKGYLGLGYMISKNVGIQLDAHLGLSNSTLSFTANNVNLNYSNGTSILSNMTVEQRAVFPVNLVPSMVVTTACSQWDVYCRMGVALPVHSRIEKERTISNAPGTGVLTQTRETWEVRSSFSSGLAAAAGFQYNISPSLSIWGEVSVLSMSLYIKEAQLTDFSYNGQSIPLGQLSGTMTYNYNKNTTFDTANLSTQPAYSQPFSNVGFNVGIRTTLGSTRKRDIEEADNRRKHR